MSTWDKIHNFFFPKDFWMQLAVGRQVGAQHAIADKLYGFGKFIRRKVDPKHKMKVGKNKEKRKK